MLKITKKKDYFEISDKINRILILTKKYDFGVNIYIGERTKICNDSGGPMEFLVIGDNVQIHHDSTIMVPSFSVLDYTKINNGFYAYGTNDLKIGYNCWFGGMTVVDTLGGLEIKNNVCIASHSQIYSHAKFGDTLFGCRINSSKEIFLSDDVWIAPNCIVTMASMAPKSMLLANSVLTKDAIENNIYAGIPARNITSKVGPQFNEEVDYEKVCLKLKEYLKDFYSSNQPSNKGTIKISLDLPEKREDSITYFVINDRSYTKRKSEEEIAFMKFLLPDKGKFIPYKEI